MTAFAGDDVVPDAAVVMDRYAEFDVPAAVLWPWLVQLGKGRAGWYAPRWLESAIPRARRGLRQLDPRWQLSVGDVVPDYGPGNPTFRVELLDAPHALVYASERGRARFSWALLVQDSTTGCRVHLRLRISRAGRLVRTVGDAFDRATVAAMFAGLRERLR